MSDNLDFNNDAQQLDPYALIPEDTIVKVIMLLKGNSEDGLVNSKSGSKMLDCEFAILDGMYKGKLFWQYLVLSGGKQDSNGKSIAGNISRSTLRAILESSRDIGSNDTSKKAIAARQVKTYWDFHEMEFVAKIGIEKARVNTQYNDKNKIKQVIIPDDKEYADIKSGVLTNVDNAKQPAKSTNTQQWSNEETDDTPPPADDIPDWAK